MYAEFDDDVAGQIRPLGVYDNLQKSAEYWYIMPRVLIFRSAISLGISVFSRITQKDPLLPVLDGVKTQTSRVHADGNMVCNTYTTVRNIRTALRNTCLLRVTCKSSSACSVLYLLGLFMYLLSPHFLQDVLCV